MSTASKNRSRQQAKRRLKRIEAQRICSALNANPRRRTSRSSEHPEEVFTDHFHVGPGNSIRRTRVQSRRLDQIDETKVSLAFWLMTKHMTEQDKKKANNLRKPDSE
jgi:hypothetical protein